MADLDDERMTSAGLLGRARSVARGEGVSVWRQIADTLEAEIEGGRLGAGAQLATEAVLAERFDVNRHTVRRALAALAARGLVRATRGRGTFVEARTLTYPIGRRTRFSDIVSRIGQEARGELLASREVEADPALSRILAIPDGGAVLELTTLHRADDIPISTAHTCLPLPRFAGFAQAYAEHGSITRAHATFGITDYTRKATRITARTATPDEAAVLDLAAGRVVMVVESLNVDEHGSPIQSTRSAFSADRVEFLIES